MSLLQNSNAISAGGDYEITDSLRLRSSASSYLSRTPTTAGNRQKYTISVWVKRGQLGAGGQIIQQRDDVNGSQQFALYFLVGDTLRVLGQPGTGGSDILLDTTSVYRDTSAWYHIVLAMDTTQATASDRTKLYVNGEQVTSFVSATYPTLNLNTAYNNTVRTLIGCQRPNASATLNGFFDGYMTEFNSVDGQALDPSSFGKFDSDGIWKPKKFYGPYGTNGFYLPMKETTQATGFNTVLWEGNNGTQSISNVGFSPDLVWTKRRTTTGSNILQDTVRGSNGYLASNLTNTEGLLTNGITSFNSNGFTLGSNGSHNQSGDDYVAWCWDAGSADTLTGAAEFDGTGDYLSAPASEYTNYINGTSDFTIEWWVNYDALPTSGFGAGWYAQDSGAAVVSPFNLVQGGNNWYLWATTANGAWNIYNQYTLATTSLTTNRWYHIACVRNNGTLTLYVDGVAAGNDGGTIGSSNIWQDTSHNLSLFSRWQSQGSVGGIDGTISNYRIVKGTAVYTGNFTPPTAPLEVIANTKLLTCNRPTTFADESGNITITANGNIFAGQVDFFIENNNTDGSITSTVRANPATGFSIVNWTSGGTTTTETVGHGMGSTPSMIILKNRDLSDNWWVWHNTFSNPEYDYLNLNGTGAISTNINPMWGASGGMSSSTFGIREGGFASNGQRLIAYCFSEVSGYSKFGSYTGTGTSGLSITTGFRPAFLMVKSSDSVQHWVIHDNTRSPSNVGTNILFPSLSNAETTDATYEVEFTDNGFNLNNTNAAWNAAGSTYIYMAFADTRDNQWNFDSSGNKNNWEPTNIAGSEASEHYYDLSNDVPHVINEDVANYPLLNPNSSYDSTTILNALTRIEAVAVNAWQRTDATMQLPSTGKYYWEYICGGVASGGQNYYMCGIISNAEQYPPQGVNDYPGYRVDQYGYFGQNGFIYSSGTNSGGLYGSVTYTTNDVIGVAVDMDAGRLWFSKNGVWVNSGDPTNPNDTNDATTAVTGSNSPFNTSLRWTPSFSLYNAAQLKYVNFGQTPFKYSMPTGYKKLNSFNLTDSTITDGSQYMNTVTYTGDGSSSKSLSVGFSPDLSWFKAQDATYSHQLVDSVRGAGYPLFSNLTNAESYYGTVSSFDSDGVTLDASTYAGTNGNGTSFVSWHWRSSDSTAVSNTDGTITSTVSANTTSGFSVVTYTGNSTAGSTVGHGLGAKPDVILLKSRSDIDNWRGYHSALGATKDIVLNSTSGASTNSSRWNNTEPTSSVFTIGIDDGVNENGDNFVAYCFAEVEGFSKFSSYTGNGSTDGPFTYLGFRPAFILYKRSDTTGNWRIQDTTRDTNNDGNSYELFPNLNNAEGSSPRFHILSNGFKAIDNTADTNASGGTYIYMAFAENPFKNSLAR